MITWQQDTAAVGQNFSIHGPTVSNMQVFLEHFLNNSGASNGVAQWTNVGQQRLSPAFVVNSIAFLQFDGVILFNAAGTFSIQASEGTAGNSFSTLTDSFCDIWPIT